MTWNRQRRAEAILKEKIAVIVLERLSDPRLGFVTVVGVQLSRDKRVATVRFTTWGTEAERRTTQRALQDATPRVQELLAPTLSMRHLPELRFVYDETVEKESRLLGLIENLAEERKEHATDAAPPEASAVWVEPHGSSPPQGRDDDDYEEDDEDEDDEDDDDLDDLDEVDDDEDDEDGDDDDEDEDFEELSSESSPELRYPEGRESA